MEKRSFIESELEDLFDAQKNNYSDLRNTSSVKKKKQSLTNEFAREHDSDSEDSDSCSDVSETQKKSPSSGESNSE